MLVKKREVDLFGWASLAFPFLVLVSVNFASPTFQDCVSHAGPEGAHYNPDNYGYFVAAFIRGQAVCGGKLVDSHSGLFLAFFTAVLWFSTHRLWLASREQGAKMEESIGHAASAATSMASVAASLKINAAQIVETVEINRGIAKQQRKLGETQLRAYVSVLSGQVTPQMGGGVRFAAYPILVNTGHTAALNIKYQINIGILPGPAHLSPRHRFSLPPAAGGSSILPPQDKRTMNAIMGLQIWPQLVPVVKFGVEYCLYVWGVVTYDDIFKKRRRTTFLHRYYWVDSGEFDINWNRLESAQAQYLPRHNKAS